MTHCHHAHGHGHGHDDDDASGTQHAQNESLSDLRASCCCAVSVSGDCVNAPHDDDSQQLHGVVGADQHLPEDRTSKQPTQSALLFQSNLLVGLYTPITMRYTLTGVWQEPSLHDDKTVLVQAGALSLTLSQPTSSHHADLLQQPAFTAMVTAHAFSLQCMVHSMVYTVHMHAGKRAMGRQSAGPLQQT